MASKLIRTVQSDEGVTVNLFIFAPVPRVTVADPAVTVYGSLSFTWYPDLGDAVIVVVPETVPQESLLDTAVMVYEAPPDVVIETDLKP